MNELTFTITQIPTLPDGSRFKAVPESWDLGQPLGYGPTIQAAIDDLLESWEMKYDVTPTFKWR